MKNITTLFLLATLGTSSAFALKASNIDLRCVNEYPTTSFFAREQGEDVVVDIMHHNGVEFTPFRNSLITPSDVPLIAKQAETLVKLSPNMTFRWKKAGCKAEGPLFFECFGQAEETLVNGLKVKPGYISVVETTEKMIDYSYSKRSISVSFRIDGEDFKITNEFFDEDCHKNLDQERSKKPARK